MIVQDVLDHIKHALDGDIADLSATTLVNQAGVHLFSMHRWKFMERSPTVYLDGRAAITFTDGTWDQSALELSSTGSFADYDWVEGDTLRVTGGTSATVGVYRITSRVDDDTVKLEDDTISSSDLATGDISIDTEYGLSAVALPSDFGGFIQPAVTETLIGSLRIRTLAEVQKRRTDSINDAALDFWGAIAHAAPTTAGRPVPRLELWPHPAANDADQFTLMYRAKWVDVLAETDTLPIPEYADTLMILLARAFAQGYEEDVSGSLGARINEIEQGPVFMAAKRMDSQIQRSYGPLRGGHLTAGDLTPLWTNAGSIGGPS